MSKRLIVGIVFIVLATIMIIIGITGMKVGNVLGFGAFILGINFAIPGLILTIRGLSDLVNKEEDIPISPLIQSFLDKLPASPTRLSIHNMRKIHANIPVPREYKILWAEILSFGRFPAGTVITNHGVVMKSPKKLVESDDTAENLKSKKKKNKKKYESNYRIIPWEYFSPLDYRIMVSDKGFAFMFDKKTDFYFANKDLFNSFVELYKQNLDLKKKSREIQESSVQSAVNTVNVYSTLYCAKNSTQTGHGIWAEDVGSQLDKLTGNSSTVVGRDNAKNGPDKLVNGQAVQCKYCQTAAKTINECFQEGEFRYIANDGKPMQIEVPKDQYPEALMKMKTKISEGKVKGVTDPEEANSIIREGILTYRQVRNLARAGTLESIAYDAASGAVTCLVPLGLSFIVSFAQIYWQTKDFKQAVKGAVITGLKVYGGSVAAYVISAQIARAIPQGLLNSVQGIITKLPEETVKKIATATGALARKGMAVSADSQYFAKYLTAQVTVQCAVFLIYSTPDLFRVASHSISMGQFAMNMADRVAGTVGSIVPSTIVSTAIGQAGHPVIGGIVGFGVGMVGGFITRVVVDKFVHLFREDDEVLAGRLFTGILTLTMMDYMLSVDEQKILVDQISRENKKMKRLQKKIIKSRHQVNTIKKYLVPRIEAIVRNRPVINTNDEQMIIYNAGDIIAKEELVYDV